MTKKKCFVISPIGDDGSPERAEADWFREIVNDALGEEFEIQRADDIVKTDLITNQIIQAIDGADLIVADLTNHNPNVHYELGVAHAQRKHVIPMISKGQRLPFDNMPVRTIFYSRFHPKDVRDAVRALKNAAKEELAGKVQNPVTLAIGVQELKESGDSRDQVVATLTERMDRLTGIVESLHRPRPQSDIFPTAEGSPLWASVRDVAAKWAFQQLSAREQEEFHLKVEALEQAKDPISMADRHAILEEILAKRRSR